MYEQVVKNGDTPPADFEISGKKLRGATPPVRRGLRPARGLGQNHASLYPAASPMAEPVNANRILDISLTITRYHIQRIFGRYISNITVHHIERIHQSSLSRISSSSTATSPCHTTLNRSPQPRLLPLPQAYERRALQSW